MAHIPWIDPSRPLPDWLQTELPPDAPYSRRHAWEYYRTLYRQTPLWAQREPLAAIYREADRQRRLGYKVHVDHMVPLNGTIVRGLHWHGNLEIITTKENYAKSNHIWPGMPFEPQELELAVDPYQMKLL